MAISFGSTDQLLAPAATNPTQYTMACWWKPTNAAGSGTISKAFSWGISGGAAEGGFSWDNSNAAYQQAFYHKTGASFPVAKFSATTLAAGTLYHVCGTYDGSRIRCYLNGAIDTTSAATTDPDTNSGVQFALGKNTLGGSNVGAVGLMAEAAVWNVRLLADEIAALAKGYVPPLIRPASLLYYLPLVRENIALRGPAWTLTGTSVANHVRVIQRHRRLMLSQAAAAVAATPQKLAGAQRFGLASISGLAG